MEIGREEEEKQKKNDMRDRKGIELDWKGFLLFNEVDLEIQCFIEFMFIGDLFKRSVMRILDQKI